MSEETAGKSRTARIAIIALIIAFSLARGFCSVAAKDVLGKTIPRDRRGQLTGWSASAAGLVFGDPPRSALMRRGDSAGHQLGRREYYPAEPGWRVRGERMTFSRAIYAQGEPIGLAWVELSIAALYAEIAQQQAADVTLFIRNADNALLAAACCHAAGRSRPTPGCRSSRRRSTR